VNAAKSVVPSTASSDFKNLRLFIVFPLSCINLNKVYADKAYLSNKSLAVRLMHGTINNVRRICL
jgi:hypothetical protein